MITRAQLKNIIYAPLTIPAIISYFLLIEETKNKVIEDVKAYWRHTKSREYKSNFYMWYSLLCCNIEFRNIFYFRVGYWGNLLAFFIKPLSSLFLNPPFRSNYSGGLYISHGYSTRIEPSHIGKNLRMHHNVTIGMKGEGRPYIGDNVYIGTGAVIIGNIKIGNNVHIGANSIIVKDVPDNCTVVSPPAYIVKREGKRVHEEL